jgi:hypothetical protein
MKKGTLIVLTVLMVALLFVLTSAVSAKPNESGSMECVLNIAYDEYAPEDFYWLGTVTGCSIAGTIKFWEEDLNYVVGKTEHFFEVFTIEPDSGGVINGRDEGVWNFSTFKFRANGCVTDASEEWAHLVGNKYHEMGTTSNPDEGLPITAPGGMMRLAPAEAPCIP